MNNMYSNLEGNNTNGEIAHVRDSYFDSGEKEYLEDLLKDPKEMEIHRELLKEKAEILYRKAKEIMIAVESGELNEDQMAEAEYFLTHLLAAIEDLEKVLVLEKTRELDNKERPSNEIYNYNTYQYDEKEVEEEEDLGLTI